VYVDEGYDDGGDEMRVAGPGHKCIECSREIETGEQYEFSWGVKLDDDEEVYESDKYTTCRDCSSMREAFFCEGWYIGRTWDDLGDHLYDVVRFGDSVSSDCLTQLTKPARDAVCDIIDEIWEEWEGR
jgi:DNA-directed RNA polymerase subunit RPC12/RpoP